MASVLDKTGLVLCVGKLCGLREQKLERAGASPRTPGAEKQGSFAKRVFQVPPWSGIVFMFHSRYKVKGSIICHSKICLFGLKIILGYLLFRNRRSRRSSESK